MQVREHLHNLAYYNVGVLFFEGPDVLYMVQNWTTIEDFWYDVVILFVLDKLKSLHHSGMIIFSQYLDLIFQELLIGLIIFQYTLTDHFNGESIIIITELDIIWVFIHLHPVVFRLLKAFPYGSKWTDA